MEPCQRWNLAKGKETVGSDNESEWAYLRGGCKSQNATETEPQDRVVCLLLFIEIYTKNMQK